MNWNAKLYDSKHSFVSKYGEDLIDLLNPQPGQTILDLGCGTGELTQIIHQRGSDVIGMDSSAEMISTAQQKYPDLKFYVQDARNFSFDVSFDAVFSNAVLHWIPEADQVLLNIYSHLKTHGTFIAEFGGKGNVAGMISAMKDALNEFGFHEQASYNPWFYPSVGEFAQMLERKHFMIQWAQHFHRETQLEGEDGMKNWFRMFRANFFTNIPQDIQEKILDSIESKLRPTHYRNNQWYADYFRIRIIAVKY